VRELITGLALFLCAGVCGAEEDETESSNKTVAVAGNTEEKTSEPVEAVPNPERKVDREALGWAIDGYLMLDTRYRNAAAENDLDIILHAYVDAHRTTDTGVTWRGLFNGRMIADLVGNQQPNDFLYSFWDTFDGSVQGRLYEAFAEGSGLGKGHWSFRVGRQFIDEGVYFHVDGARVDWKGEKATVSVIGGAPVRLSQTSVDTNWLIGLVARAPIGDKTRVRFSYYHIEESFPGINFPVVDPPNQPVSIPPTTLKDDYFGFTGWHRFAKNLPFFGRFTLLNGRANELHLRLRWFTMDGKWRAHVEWYQMFNRLVNVTNDLTPYVPMMGSFDPFFRLTARVVRRVGNEWVLQAGLAWRQLENESDEGVFNHTFGQYSFIATRSGLADGKLDITLSGIGYNSTQRNDTFVTNLNATYRLSRTLLLSGGVDYSLYKYVYFNNSEREDVWTTWVRLRWEARKDIRVEGGVSVDDDRHTTYTAIFIRVTWRF